MVSARHVADHGGSRTIGRGLSPGPGADSDAKGRQCAARMADVTATRTLSEDVLTGPADFDDFWRDRYAAARAVDPRPRRARELERGDGWRLTEVRYSSTDGLDLGAFLLEPDGDVHRVVIGLAGYGGAHEPFDPLREPGVVELSPAVRGMPALSRVADIPDEASAHVLHGIDDPERYVLTGCVQDVWTAVTAARQLFGQEVRIDLRGSSFGGGLGALAMPWESRLTAAALRVPTFGNHPQRLRTPCSGSGERVRLLAQRRPEITRTLRYVDAATAATRTTQPVLVGAARTDPAVPPVGQIAIYDALAGPRVLVELTAGHLEFDGQEREETLFRAASRAWLDL